MKFKFQESVGRTVKGVEKQRLSQLTGYTYTIPYLENHHLSQVQRRIEIPGNSRKFTEIMDRSTRGYYSLGQRRDIIGRRFVMIKLIWFTEREINDSRRSRECRRGIIVIVIVPNNTEIDPARYKDDLSPGSSL